MIMKRIIVDARESGTSTGRYLDKLVEYMHKLQPAYEVILLIKPQRKAFMQHIAPGYKTVNSAYKEFSFGEQLGLRKQIKKLKADLVFFPMVQQPVLYKGRVVTTMQDLTTLRFRNTAKNWFVFTFKQQVYKWVNKRVAKKSSLLITPTQFVKNDVANYCNLEPSKITVTYESADKIPDRSEPILALKNKPFLLYVGRPAANKNLHRLVDAYVILKKHNPGLVLVFAGKLDGEYQKLRQYSRKKAGGGILFTGFVSEGQLRWLYENAKVYVFPSLSEGFGLPGLEAMQYGLPVASSNATCLPEVYKNAAHYFNPFSSQHMATKVQQILDDPKLAAKLSANGYSLLKLYSWEKMARQTINVFERALKY
jgi:glycosyltransferase involved in cell wall biosynthesis